VFETGPLSVWFYHELTALGLPATCIDARHAKATLDMAANKTDANDADGLAHLAENGWRVAHRLRRPQDDHRAARPHYPPLRHRRNRQRQLALCWSTS
jgi:transposase